MTLNEFARQLNALVEQGHGDKKILCRHGGSGVCAELSSARITNDVDCETGPFDLADGEHYVSIYAGN